MTSSSAYISPSNNTASSLPSPPLSHQYNHSIYYDKRIPTFTVDRAPSAYTVCDGGDRSGLLSDTRYTSNNNRCRDVAELRPFLFNPVSNNNNNSKYQLPPIRNIMTTPTSSPSPPFDYYGISLSSPISSVASSPTPIDEEDVDCVDQQQRHLLNIRRKGSIASLLNSDPELRQLDEEESKCNYQSHFIDNYPPSTQQFHQTSLKRGRPRQGHTETVYNSYYQHYPIIKKQRLNSIQGSHDFDCVQQQQQACQPSSLVMTNTNFMLNSINHGSPRAAKGLRHFSKQVCDKVAEKGVTTYNEVADELALDIQASVGKERHSYDQKNIRRRVYDALNVLMAMNIIAKDKKVIKWLGIPDCYKQNKNAEVVENGDEDISSSRKMLLAQIEQEELRHSELVRSLDGLRESVSQKLSKHLQIRNLVWRNQQDSKQNNPSRISLPFFIVACPTAKDVQIDIVNHSQSAVITIQHDKEYNFNKIVYEDSDVLQHLNLTDVGDPLATRS